MWIQFLLENIHFAVYLFTALIFFAVFWLYFDAWEQRRSAIEGIKLVGFAAIAVSFVVESLVVESTIVPVSLWNGLSVALLGSGIRIAGYVILISGLLADPLQEEPMSRKTSAAIIVPAGFIATTGFLLFLEPVLATVIALLYLRRATIGLEDHLKPVSYSFFVIAVFGLCKMSALFLDSSNLTVYQLVAPFGLLWMVSLVFLCIAGIVLCRWVFGYLLKQFQAQLFMVYTSTIVVIFLITTVSFTGLLLRNMESESLRQITTDVKVLNFAIQGQKEQEIASARSIALDPAIFEAIDTSDRKSLGDMAATHLITKNLSTVIITSETGQVLARGEERDRIGDSLSADPLVKRGLLGETASTIVAKDGVLAPDISVRAVVPVLRPNGSVAGGVVVGKALDTAFVDGLKKATGLDASIYGDNIVSATTFTSPDGRSRLIGTKVEHAPVKTEVLGKGLPYAGTMTLQGSGYIAAFLPLNDVDANPVGMVFVGRPQISILQAAGQSIQYTFVVTAMLLVLSIIPAYLVTRYIANQL